MKEFMIIARVHNANFLTKVTAESESAAERKVLDLSYCGRHAYGVEACMAYDADAMKTDCFIGAALGANPVSNKELREIIEVWNDEIRAKDEAESRIEEIEKQMKQLQKELEQAKATLAK